MSVSGLARRLKKQHHRIEAFREFGFAFVVESTINHLEEMAGRPPFQGFGASIVFRTV
jgi:hypothetical protein